jgi:hypothetical protein
MKKLFTTLLLLSAVLVSKANYNHSSLNITSVDGGYFTIAIDHPQFEAPSINMTVGDLAPGNHYIKVARWVDYGYHPGYKTVFAGYVFVPKQSEMTAIVTHNHFKVTDIRPIAVCQEPVVYQNNYNYPPAPVCHPVNEYDFNQMLSSIEHRSFESTRMQLAKQLINDNFFTSRQVTLLLNSMTFESTKLELAKYAYNKTVDRNNYYLVNDAFTFESSITDLSRFISSQG